MSKSLFRSILVASVILGLVGGLCDLVFPELVPLPLHQAEGALLRSASPLFAIGVGACAVLLIVVVIISTIGLFLFRPWAPRLAVIAYFMSLPFYPAIGYSLHSGWATALGEFSTMLWGGILALVYYSPIKDWFSREKP
jgi:hypothetical protein